MLPYDQGNSQSNIPLSHAWGKAWGSETLIHVPKVLQEVTGNTRKQDMSHS